MSRRVLPVFLALTMALLVGCAGQKAETQPTSAPENAILTYLGWTGTEAPYACRVYLDDGARQEVYVDDAQLVSDIWQAASAITVGAESNTFVTDSYHYVEFLFSDGSTLSINFNARNLDQGDHVFTLDHVDELWTLLQSVSNQ